MQALGVGSREPAQLYLAYLAHSSAYTFSATMSALRRVPQPSTINHELKHSPTLGRVDFADLADLLLLKLAIAFHRFSENGIFNRQVGFRLYMQLLAEVSLFGQKQLEIRRAIRRHLQRRETGYCLQGCSLGRSIVA